MDAVIDPQASQVFQDEERHHQVFEGPGPLAEMVLDAVEQEEDAGEHQHHHEDIEIGANRRVGVLQQIIDRLLYAPVSLRLFQLVGQPHNAIGKTHGLVATSSRSVSARRT